MAFATLMYHDVIDGSGEYDVSPAQLLEHMRWLDGEGYVAESAAAARARLERGDALPERYVVLTFDDGFRSFLRAAEVVNRFGFSASFFLTRDLCQERADHLDPAEVRELSELGDVGGHGTTHSMLSKLPREQARAELREAREWIQQTTGKAATTMSAPQGGIDRNVVRMAREEGYAVIGNSREWPNRGPQVLSSGVLHRVPVLRSHSLDHVKRIVSLEPRFYARRGARFLLREALWTVMNEEQVNRLARLRKRLIPQ